MERKKGNYTIIFVKNFYGVAEMAPLKLIFKEISIETFILLAHVTSHER